MIRENLPVPTIALITDFGHADWYVGVMKGVILKVAPSVSIVDVSHDIPSGDIRAGAFTLLSCFSYFRAGTIFVAVVDPGVGSSRLPIAAQAGGYTFIGPDNGVLSWALAGQKNVRVRELSNPVLRQEPVSATFHGRDIFAPAAAHLASGISFNRCGPVVLRPCELPFPGPVASPDEICGEVMHIDRFGNIITTIDAGILNRMASGQKRIRLGRRTVSFGRCYDDVPAGKAVALIGSGGYLEISVNRGHAANMLCAAIGDRVRVVAVRRSRE